MLLKNWKVYGKCSDHFTSEETALETYQLTSQKYMWESKIETYCGNDYDSLAVYK